MSLEMKAHELPVGLVHLPRFFEHVPVGEGGYVRCEMRNAKVACHFKWGDARYDVEAVDWGCSKGTSDPSDCIVLYMVHMFYVFDDAFSPLGIPERKAI